jgi:hypothetical protein
MRKLTMLAVLLAFVGASPALAGSPPNWTDRLSFGVDGEGASWSGSVDNQSSFLPGAYLSYSATSGLSFAGTLQRDFARHTSIGQGGFRFIILGGDRGHVALGMNVVGYGDRTAWLGIVKPTSWNACVNGSYDLVQDKNGTTILYGIAGASDDVDNDLKQVHIGLRWCILGGHRY